MLMYDISVINKKIEDVREELSQENLSSVKDLGAKIQKTSSKNKNIEK